MIDITEQKRTEHAAELFAEPGSARDKLELMIRQTRSPPCWSDLCTSRARPTTSQ